VLALAVAPLLASDANAGCGCDKPPPPPAAVRPAFASPGQTIALFDNELKVGRTYRVKFDGNTDSEAVTVTAVKKRDLADGVRKPQLVVTVPWMSPGPTKIRVTRDGDNVMRVDDEDFTVLQPQLQLTETDAVTTAKCYRAAVGGDGTVYFPFNISQISQRMVFSGLAEGYPLLFDSSDVAIYNAQCFLMQLLSPTQSGTLFTISDPGSPDSLELTYDRHEFVTYKSQHVHEGNLALDPDDPAWHMDGTRHVDHDNLVIAISGVVEGGGRPLAGQTPPFNFSVVTALVSTSTPISTRTIQWGDCGSRG